MRNFIESIFVVCEDIIKQLMNEKLEKESISFKNKIELKDTIAVVTSVKSRENRFQIMVNFSEQLARNIASLMNDGVPVVTVDNQVKQIVMELSKLIIANSMIYLEDYDEKCLPSPPCIMESESIIYSSESDMIILKFKLLNEILTVNIVVADERYRVTTQKGISS